MCLLDEHNILVHHTHTSIPEEDILMALMPLATPVLLPQWPQWPASTNVPGGEDARLSRTSQPGRAHAPFLAGCPGQHPSICTLQLHPLSERSVDLVGGKANSGRVNKMFS